MTSQAKRETVLRKFKQRFTVSEIAAQLDMSVAEVCDIIRSRNRPPAPPRKVEFIEPKFDV